LTCWPFSLDAETSGGQKPAGLLVRIWAVSLLLMLAIVVCVVSGMQHEVRSSVRRGDARDRCRGRQFRHDSHLR
jgi:hypothetical protein